MKNQKLVPSKPFPPILPKKTVIQWYNLKTFYLDSFNEFKLNRLKEFIQDDFENPTLENISFSLDLECPGKITFSYFLEIPNSNYESEYTLYSQNLIQYNLSLKDYNLKLKQYQKELEKQEIIELEQRLNKLKSGK